MRANVWCAWSVWVLVAVPVVASADSMVADAAKRQDRMAVRALLKQKAEVNAPQPDGATALHWAAHWDDLDTAGLLIASGANVNAKNDYDVTPLALASTNGNVAMVQRLMKAGAGVNAADSTGETALMTAVRAGSVPVVKALIAGGAKVNAKGGGREQTALMWAVNRRQLDIVKVLLEHGADVHAKSLLRPEYVSFSRGNPQGGRQTGIADATAESDGSRPGLRWIKEGGFTAFLFAARAGDMDAARVLLAAGANVNDMDGVGSTALMMAVRNDHAALASYLLEKGADPNVTEAGHTPLHLAVARRNLDLVRQLLAKGAKPNVQMTKGEPDPDGEVQYNQLPEYLAGATPFVLAAGLNELEMMKVLAASGADPKIPMLDGTTSTMASMGLFPGVFQFIPFQKIGPTGAIRADNPAYFMRKELVDDWSVLEAVRMTLELGVDVNAARGKLTTYHVGNSRTLVGRDVGDTALHMAAADKLWNVVELLVKSGARMDVKDRRGLTPLGIATSKNLQFQTGGGGEPIGDENIAALLRSLGAKE